MAGFMQPTRARSKILLNRAELHMRVHTMLDAVSMIAVPALFFIVFIATLGYCIWSLDRGFDITDESYDLLLAMHPHEYQVFVSAAYWVTSLLWTASGTLYGFRALGLAILLAGALLLATGAIRASSFYGLAIQNRWTVRLAIVASTMVAMLHWDSYGASIFFTPSYNLLSIAAIYAATGLTLHTAGRSWGWQSFLLHALAGACLAIAFLSKFTCGIVSTLLVLLIIGTLHAGSRGRLLRGASTVISLSIIVVVLALSQMSIAAAASNFRLGLSFYGSYGEPMGVRLIRDAAELGSHWVETCKSFAVPLLSFAIFAVWRSRIAAFLGIVTIAATIALQKYPESALDRVGLHITALDAIMIAILIVTFRTWARTPRTMFFVALLLLLPYCIAIGTSNAFPEQIIVELGSWGSLFAILTFCCEDRVRSRSITVALSTLFVIVCAAQIWSSGFSGSYPFSRPLFDQAEPVTIGSLGVVRVDPGIRQFVLQWSEAGKRCNVQPGSPLLSIYNAPGAALVLRAIPVETPWLVTASQTEPWLERAPVEKVRSAAVALNVADPTHPRMPPILARFPSGYQFCGQAYLPPGGRLLQLWIPTSTPRSSRRHSLTTGLFQHER
jgi:hypothetical protein